MESFLYKGDLSGKAETLCSNASDVAPFTLQTYKRMIPVLKHVLFSLRNEL